MRVAVAVLAFFCGFALGMPDAVALDIGTATHHGPSRAAFASRREPGPDLSPPTANFRGLFNVFSLAWTIWPELQDKVSPRSRQSCYVTLEPSSQPRHAAHPPPPPPLTL